MIEPFLISDDRLRVLSATRQGRVSIAGYNYQAAYAVARLAAMSLRQPVLDVQDWPQRLRYDWGEDLDEVSDDGTVRFTQCKRIATIAQPASLADVLTGFSPKWLWVPEPDRDRLRFRLVCSDPRFAVGGTSLESLKADVCGHFLTRLKKPARPHSDRAVWIAEAGTIGHEVLFDALWSRLDCVYLPAEVVDSEPSGPRLAAEKEALRVLLERGRIDPSGQIQVLGRLRRLIHDLDGLLLTYLLTIATPQQLSPRVSQITAWLEMHPDVTDVRTQYLSFLLKLPAEFSNMRAAAARQTAEWLKAHGEDTSVRAQYLLFLLQLPAEFSDMRAAAARETAEWLEAHDEDTGVRSNFLPFLSEIPYSQTATDGTMPVDEWQQLASDSLNDAADLTIRSGWQRQHQILVTSYPRLHLALLRSLKLHDSDFVREVLRVSHDVAAEWCVRNPSSRLQSHLALP